MDPYPWDNIDAAIGDQELVEAELARTSTLKGVPRPSRASLRAAEPEDELEGHLTVDVYQTPSEIVISSAVAGVDPDELDITATTESVSIKGERRREHEVRKEDYLHEECYWGRFSRTILLPEEVDPNHAIVRFKNGILTIRLPKTDFRTPKKLKVGKQEV